MIHKVKFRKYHGCGNDFILVDEMGAARTPDTERSKIAKRLCDRHFSVGADGVIFIELPEDADGSMRLFEPAGNEADMCGNGIRCVASYLCEKLGKSEVYILTRDGPKHIVRSHGQFRVDMGVVRGSRRDLEEYISDKGRPDDLMSNVRVSAGSQEFTGIMVNTGEPHIVIKVDDITALDVRGIGEIVNKDLARFPKGVNLDFVEVVEGDRLKVRTYERGVYDETLACGTGATAGAAVALSSGWMKGTQVRMEALGGCLTIELGADGRAYMMGPAELVFEGEAVVET